MADLNVRLPDQVRRQIEQANKDREAWLSATGANGEDTLADGNDEDSLVNGNDDDTLDDGNADDTLDDGNGEDTIQGGNEPDKVVGVDTRHARELDQLRADNDALRRDLAGMRGEIERLAKPRTEPKPAPTTAAAVRKRLTHEQRRDAGDELIAVITGVAHEVLGPEVDALRVENTELKRRLETVGTTVQATTKAQFYDQLDGKVEGGWRQLDEDQKFLDWLRQVDRYSRKPRHVLLDARVEALDAEGAAVFFNDYLAESGHASPTPATSRSPGNGHPAGQNGKVRLETLAAPGRRGGTSTANNTRRGRIWSESSISKFYEDRRRGAYKGREAEAAELEKDLFAAQGEGRVTA